MPHYKFTVTRDITESAQVTVEADTLEEAQAKALTPEALEDVVFEIDDNEPGDAYLPDPDDWEEVETSVCDDCGSEVAEIIGCPDGAEICQDCFDAGAH